MCAAPQRREKEATLKPAAQKLRIVILGDESWMAPQGVERIRERGFEIHVTRSVEEALRLADTEGETWGFVDTELPGLDWYEDALQIVQHPARPFRALGLLVRPEDVGSTEGFLKSSQLGIDFALAKPADDRELWAYLRRFLRSLGLAPCPLPAA